MLRKEEALTLTPPSFEGAKAGTVSRADGAIIRTLWAPASREDLRAALTLLLPLHQEGWTIEGGRGGWSLTRVEGGGEEEKVEVLFNFHLHREGLVLGVFVGGEAPSSQPVQLGVRRIFLAGPQGGLPEGEDPRGYARGVLLPLVKTLKDRYPQAKLWGEVLRRDGGKLVSIPLGL